MISKTEPGQTDGLGDQREVDHGVYVYGIVDSAEPVPSDLPSVGDGDAKVRLATRGGLSALISEVMLNRPLGKREDLLAHERVLEAVAGDRTVLPMRFGSVVRTEEAVVDELLAPHHEHFESVICELSGLVQFTIRGRYVDSAHLREIVQEDAEIRELRAALQEVDDEAGYADRLRMGELVNEAVERKRAADAETLVEALKPGVVATAGHQVAGEDGAVDMAFLVERQRRAEFERAVDELGEQWRERVRLRLIGPLAPYDFLPEG